MEALGPRVFSIPPGCPFLPTLIDGLVEGRVLPGITDVSAATLYLPTRRAARALTALLAERAGGKALLLPRIVALGEAEEAEFDIAANSAFEDADVLAPPIAPLERRLILTQLVQAWSRSVNRDLLRLDAGIPFAVPASPADAINLAGELEALMDAIATEGVPWEDIANAVEAEYSQYFALTLDFLRIAAENWPAMLKERGASDPAKRRNALIAAEAQRLLRERPTAPVIAAGSTGSVPATASLLAAIARLPNAARWRSWAPRRRRPSTAAACCPRPCAPPTPPRAGRISRQQSAPTSPGAARTASPSWKRWTSVTRRSPPPSRFARRWSNPARPRP
jgi:ATP-dependent helicase/nuclease subunit B